MSDKVKSIPLPAQVVVRFVIKDLEGNELFWQETEPVDKGTKIEIQVPEQIDLV